MHLHHLIEALRQPRGGRPLAVRLVSAAKGGHADIEVTAVTDDSRAVRAGDVFAAVRGRRSDGHNFVAAAVAKGAAALIVEHELADVGVPQIVVDNGARALGHAVAALAQHPSDRLRLIGITGTNGKTTTTYLVESILAAAGKPTGVVGTVNYRWRGTSGSGNQNAAYTTPTPQILNDTFARMSRDGVSHLAMEVSSAALAMERLAAVRFSVAAFSNLTQDHLDVHGSMEAYREAKQLLFSHHLAADGVAVINVDDPEGEGMAAAATSAVLRVSAVDAPTRAAQRDAEIRVTWCDSTVRGIRARIRTPRGELSVEAPPLIGGYNVANIALAVGIGEALGLPHQTIAAGIRALAGVPGRVERVTNDQDLDILVDYAHTPDALRNVLSSVRPLCARRLICVFGCGGDRDPGKRPLMGKAAAELADLVIVTSDNPRTEVPRSIVDQILTAVPNPFFVDIDRRTAIRAAISTATPGDIVVIAGKGHEDYQILGTEKIHFDDREEAAHAVALRPSWSATDVAQITGGTLAAGTSSSPAHRIARIVIDGRTTAAGDLYVAIRGAQHDGHRFCAQAVAAGAVGVVVESTAATAVRSELTDATPVIAVEDSRQALGKLGQHHRRGWAKRDAARRLVAVTGSSGKTTTKDLVRSALAQAAPTLAADGSLNNETGVPLTLLALREFHRYAVVEMGMRGRGQIQYLSELAEPDVAIVVNAGTAHIELLGSTDAIADAKAEIWLGLRPGGVAIVPADDERLIAWAGKRAPLGCRQLRFGEAPGADIRLVSAAIVHGAHGAGTDVSLEVLGQARRLHLSMLGRHIAIDACAALAAAIAVGVDADLALAGIAAAKPPAMRGELVDVAGRAVIVDCYNANPASMASSLRALAEAAGAAPHVAIVGDMLELGVESEQAHRDVGALAAKLGVPVIALGAQRDVVVAAAGGGTSATSASDPAQAAALALASVGRGGWILLKASRGMKLERVLTAMREHVSEEST